MWHDAQTSKVQRNVVGVDNARQKRAVLKRRADSCLQHSSKTSFISSSTISIMKLKTLTSACMHSEKDEGGRRDMRHHLGGRLALYEDCMTWLDSRRYNEFQSAGCSPQRSRLPAGHSGSQSF